jgi:hypothetical protein
MTQAFNLSQLANNVNTSGQLNAAAGLYNQVTVANGGTNAASLAGNGALVMNSAGTTVTSVAAGTVGNVLTSNGTTWASSANPASTGINVMIVATTSGTWPKPATVRSIKVTVVGGGGNSGSAQGTNPPGQVSATSGGGGGGGVAIRYYSASALPGPQPYTVGGAAAASAFGVAPVTVITGSGGASSSPVAATPFTTITGANGSGGAGSGGQINVSGGVANVGGTSLYSNESPTGGMLYGGGATGVTSPSATIVPGQSGAAGIIFIEEFY